MTNGGGSAQGRTQDLLLRFGEPQRVSTEGGVEMFLPTV